MIRRKKHATFLMRPASIEALDQLQDELNKKVNIRISKGEILDLLILMAKSKEIAQNILISGLQ